MPVHVIIKRKWKIGNPEKLFPLLKELRSQAKEQPGFLSSQTLRNSDDIKYYVVISRWESAKHWEKWLLSRERRDIQGKVDSLIGEKTFYEVFETVSVEGEVLSGKR